MAEETIELSTIRERVQQVLRVIPPHVTVVAAGKGASPEQLTEALQAGIHIVGQNHVREARLVRGVIANPMQMHFIGRLRPHSVRAATIGLFDAVQSVDSFELARRMNAVCASLGREMPVFIEVNSGREAQKGGVLPEDIEALVREIATLDYIRVTGLMTMGPLSATREGFRPCFAQTRQLFDHIRGLGIAGVHLEHLSMGMSNSYEVAIEEGATMVRLGTILFGAR